MKFEEAVKRMDEIISALENPDVALDEAMKLYKEGTELAAVCRDELSKAEMLVTISDGADNE